MRCSTAVLAALAFLLQLALQTPSARAQGTITGLSFNLPAVKTCALETITVSGTGQCGVFTVDLNDGTPIAHLPGNFPILVYHAYSKQGTYTPIAKGQGNCSGSASATLQVVGPSITSMFPFSQIKPDGWVIVQGENFGNLPGKLLMHYKTFSGQQAEAQLESLQWGDTFASGMIPFIGGLVDQPVTFTVEAQCGAQSNAWSANFTAFRDVAYTAYNRIGCTMSTGATVSDECQGWGGTNFPEECGLGTWGTEITQTTGFQAYHASGWGFSGNSGNDQFSANLNNGWVLDMVTQLQWEYVGGGSTATEWFVSPAGTPNPQVGVPWHVDNCGMIWYSADIIITGPIGVPY
jgi:hypothetical protein